MVLLFLSCQNFYLKLNKSSKTWGKFPVNYFLSRFLKVNKDPQKNFDGFFCRNADGCTVFMQAVRSCSYAAALVVLDTAKRVATNESGWLDRATFMQMLYPTGSSLDNSPLQMLCCNDTCSFTWTGREHIKQVKFS